MTTKAPKILCVCGHGLGTAMVLVLTIREVLKKHDIDGGHVEARTFSTATYEPCDLIAGTPEMEEHFSKAETPSILVHSVFDKKEVEEKLAPYIRKWKQSP